MNFAYIVQWRHYQVDLYLRNVMAAKPPPIYTFLNVRYEFANL